ncbi:MAG TPA: hypothetical protein VL383_12760 [Gemmatimonadaceae bacterium]|jgi:hypothetical protein|nr:hypothetical protein [Gemmatimonadaceae bacterium]
MPELLIRIKKKSDGSAALSAVRADGTTTWQRQDGQLGRFFPLHDLTHYSVETVLGFRRAFFGLLADGWDLSDFGKRSSKELMQEEAGFAELIVGFFDLERATGVIDDADGLEEKIRSYYEQHRVPRPARVITQAEMSRIRAVRAELFARWRALPAGQALELPFERATATDPASVSA